METYSSKAQLSSLARLILIRAKIERAKVHLGAMESEALKWSSTTPVVVREANSPNSPEDIKELRQASFDLLATAGDLIQNLRTALDHLAYQLVLVAGKEPTKETSFPMAKDQSAYRDMKGQKLKGARLDAVKAIGELKPYCGGNEALWNIHALNNIDKHRMLFTIGSDIVLHADWIPSLMPRFLLRANESTFDGLFDEGSELQMSQALLPFSRQIIEYVDGLVKGFQPLLEP